MNEIYYVIVVPIFVGLLGFLINRLRTEFDLVAFLLTLFYAIRIFIATRTQIISYNVASLIGIDFRFYADSLSGFVVLFNAIFGLLIWLYSLRAMSKMPRERVYYLYLAITLSAANGVVLSGNLIFLLLFWNVLVFSLYGILQVGKVYSSGAARKAITIIGVSDYVMMLGIVIFFIRTGNINFPLETKILFADPWLVVSYVTILAGVLAKLGTVPLHTWIPEAAKVVPASTLAFIPGSLDKLLGFYLLMRFHGDDGIVAEGCTETFGFLHGFTGWLHVVGSWHGYAHSNCRCALSYVKQRALQISTFLIRRFSRISYQDD